MRPLAAALYAPDRVVGAARALLQLALESTLRRLSSFSFSVCAPVRPPEKRGLNRRRYHCAHHELLRGRVGALPGATPHPELGRGSASGKRFTRNTRGVLIPVPERGGAH